MENTTNSTMYVESGMATNSIGTFSTTCCSCNQKETLSAFDLESLIDAGIKVMSTPAVNTALVYKAQKLVDLALDQALQLVK